MTRRVLSILVAVLMVMAIIPLGALAIGNEAAAEHPNKTEKLFPDDVPTVEVDKTFIKPAKPAADTERVATNTIDKIEINGLIIPEWGATVDSTTLTVPDGANYYIDYATWASYVGYANVRGAVPDGSTFNSEDVFYYMYISVTPNDGFGFANNVEVLINGTSEYVDFAEYDDYYDCYDVYTIDFTVEDPYMIRSIEITYDDPFWGGTPADTNITIPEDAGYEILDYVWAISEKFDEFYYYIDDDEMFDDETLHYFLYMILVPKDDDYHFGYNTELTINDDPYIADPDWSGYYSYYGVYIISTMFYTVTDPDTTVAEFNFESDPVAEGWKFIDKDTDHTSECNWFWETTNEEYPVSSGYQGKGLITSASYSNTIGLLEPDNWAISPAITGATKMSFYACAQDPEWPEEHFAVYAGTSPRPDQMVEVLPETVIEGVYYDDYYGEYYSYYTRYEVDLSEFAGETVYVAFRHFNCADMFRLNVDHVVFSREVVWGDADLDSQVSAADALLIMRLVQGIITEDEIDVRFLDVNADGKIDLTDALLVLRKALGVFTDPFPAEIEEPEELV